MRIRGKRRRQDVAQDDPTNIARHIIKGFNLANPNDAYNGADTEDNLRPAPLTMEEKQAWKNPVHPANSALKLVDSYPILPDWDAIPDTGSYMVYKFMAPPINNPNDPSYDERLDVALLRPSGQSAQDQETYMQEMEAHKQDPTKPLPFPRYFYEYFLPPTKDKVRGIKRNFSTYDPDNDAEIPFDVGVDDDGQPRKYFKYENIRTYETAHQQGDPEDPFGEWVALSLHDGEGDHEAEPLRSSSLQKGAYVYPISQRTMIRPKRPQDKQILMDGEQAEKVDIIETQARDPVAEVEKREAIRLKYDVQVA